MACVARLLVVQLVVGQELTVAREAGPGVVRTGAFACYLSSVVEGDREKGGRHCEQKDTSHKQGIRVGRDYVNHIAHELLVVGTYWRTKGTFSEVYFSKLGSAIHSFFIILHKLI